MMDKILSAIDKWFEVWIVIIALITGAWFFYRVVEFLSV
jgi:hypothetical protein